MATWKKLILSGSNAQVASLDILSPASTPTSLEVTGEIEFPNIPSQPDSDPWGLPEGTLVKSNTEIDGGWNIMVANDDISVIGCMDPFADNYNPDATVADNSLCDWPDGIINISLPLNPQGVPADLDNDGAVATADLLLFLSHLGSDSTSTSFYHEYDLNNDGTIGTADLLLFLSAFGDTDGNDIDMRPSINWDSIPWQVSGEAYVTIESVNTYYNAIVTASGSDAVFWSDLPSDVWTYYDGSSPPDLTSNVKGYIEQTGHSASIELFTYLYFSQHSGIEYNLISGHSITGGSNNYTITQISGIYP